MIWPLPRLVPRFASDLKVWMRCGTVDDMTASEIIKQLSPAARALLAAVPGFPVKTGAVVQPVSHEVLDELLNLGVIGDRAGLTTTGAVVAERIKRESEPF
jgi:hypothetical protein